MKRIVQVAAVSAGLGIVVITAVAGGGTASAREAHRTVHLTAVQLKLLHTGNNFVFTEKDLVAGKVAGYDSVKCHYFVHRNTSLCDGTFAGARGLTYVHVKVDGEGHGSGRITGGTGAYKNASGTVKFVGVSQTRSKFTLVYKG